MRSIRICVVLSLTAVTLWGAAVHAQQGAGAGPGARSKVGRWDRFEASVVNPRRYADPYNGVTLNVTYTRPDGSAVKFWGFHDGGTLWKVRFMPDQFGRWQYEAAFSDGSPGLKGSFECVASDLPGLISNDETNPMWFGFKGGGHTLIRALHVGDRFFAANWSAEKRSAFLDWAGKQGYNTLSIASHYLNRDSPSRGRGWDTPKLWALDAAEYRKLEAILDDLARRRVIVFPFAGFFGQSSNYPRDPADQERYVRYTLARLGCYWNLLWNVAGPEPNVQKAWMDAKVVERLGRLIGKLDPFGHPLSVHNRTGDDPYRDSDWTTYGVLQGPKTVDRQRLSRGLRESHHPRKPLLAQETLWSGNVNHIRSIGRDYTNDDLRKNAWVIHMSAAALVFADNDGHSSTGFSNTMELADRRQDRHDAIRPVWDFMSTVPFYRMTPRQDLVDRGYCLAEEGKQYLVYLETRGTVNVGVAKGTYNVEWINAQNTTDRRNGGTTSTGDKLTSPKDGDDWLLRLTAVAPPRDSGTRTPPVAPAGIYFPPPGEALANQDRRKPDEVGLKPNVVTELRTLTGGGRWALWRHGYLVHVEGDFNETTEVKSLRKTWHALAVGAAIKQGKIPSLEQELSAWNKELAGKDAAATWRHVITQTSGFDYPYGAFASYKPGEIWTYSDKNPRHLCNALARVYGKKDYRDNYDAVIKQAYFDAIGLGGWKSSARDDGVRFHFDLEDMGRLGLLVVARGWWQGVEVIPQWFVEELETKQTRGIPANYDGPDDGRVKEGWMHEHRREFPECPYGFMTWVNAAGDFYPGADRAWAFGSGAGGSYLLWNHRHGIVFAGFGMDTRPTKAGIPHAIEACLAGPNPLVEGKARSAAGVWPGDRWLQAAPETVGLSSSKVDAYLSWLAEKAGGKPFGTVVVRHGKVAIEHHGSGATASSAWEIGSIRKAVGSALLGIALEEKRLTLDTLVHEVWPAIHSETKEDKDKTIRVKHLFNSTSGWKRPERTGSKWVYNNAGFTAGGMVLGRAYQLPEDRIAPLAQSRIADRIGAASWRCYHFPGGFSASDGNPGPKLAIDSTLQDLARFGYLWLRQGEWNAQQVIPKDFVREATRNQAGAVGGHYGYCWFINDGRKLLPHAPEDAYFHVGNGKDNRRTVLVVIPSLDLIAVVGTDASRFDITRGYRSEPVAHVNDWVGKVVACVQDKGPRDQGHVGQFPKWTKVEVAFQGPASLGRGQPNPFGIRLDVTFTSPSGKKYRVPGFYDGDGKGGLDGSVWKVRFAADEPGKWTFVSTSADPQLEGWTGSFTVTAPAKDAPGFYGWGRLEHTGTAANQVRYLKFRDGPYWLKAGCDDPENFLGHFQNYDTPAKRRAAIDYLAARGINSLYVMTHNLDGDHRDVWPWLGKTAAEAKANGGAAARFDVARLEEWRELFEYMQAKGVVPYVILEDDSAWSGYDHARYYREMVARFGYLPALLFNLGEEANENYRPDVARKLMQQLEEIDPYDHPRGIHNVNRPDNDYVDARYLSFTSIQTGSPDGKPPDPLLHNQIARDWIERCRSRRQRILMVGFDEGRPEEDRRAWWSAYLAGGVWEAHIKPPYDRPMSTWETTWTELGGTRAFLESLPFWEMEPDNTLVKAGQAFCLAKPGAAYALYLPSGGSVTVGLTPETTYEYTWWNPANGKEGRLQDQGTIAGGHQSFTAPGRGDWALRIVRKGRE